MKKKLLLIITMFSCIFMYSQSSDCLNAQPFCTSTPIGFPASTNTTAPIGPDYGCLGSQPNPAFYFLQIDQPGNITVTMQSTPLVDIDFICWGPFSDPSTMCDSLTGPYIVDCSYSIAAIEDCDITNAITGQYYILLITNYSNVNCNIDFSQNGGLGNTSCCLAGDAGLDNTVDFCNSDPTFIMENQLNGSPNIGGSWYDGAWMNFGSNIFDPSLYSSGVFSYIVPGIPVPGATVTCPDDTANLIININPDPIIDFPAFSEVCSDANAINLNSATPSGGVYSVNGLIASVFTPDVNVVGNNLISYNFSDANGCSDTSVQPIIVHDVPLIDLGVDTTIACNSSYLLIPNITGGLAPYSYLWSNGSTIDTQIFWEGYYNLIVSDFYGCEGVDTLEIAYDAPPTINLGVDIMIACNSDTLIDPLVFGGTAPYSYQWDSGSTDSMTILSSGLYSVVVTDLFGCTGTDNFEITYDIPGTVTLSGGGSICADGTFAEMNFNFNGLLPWDLVFANGLINQTIQAITDSNYLFETKNQGIYNVVSASDVNDCLANIVGTAQVIVHPLPVAIISPAEISIYEDDVIELEVGDYAMYHWYSVEGLDLDTLSTLTVSDSGIFYVEVIDFNGCSDVSDNAIVYTKPYTNLFIPNTFTPNGDDHNELFVISGVNIKTFNIQIFNRWGELMFMSESIDKSWDGTFANKKVQEGSYYYNVKVLGDDKRMLELSGTVNIIY